MAPLEDLFLCVPSLCFLLTAQNVPEASAFAPAARPATSALASGTFIPPGAPSSK